MVAACVRLAGKPRGKISFAVINEGYAAEAGDKRWMFDELSALAPAFTEDEPSSERLLRIKNWLMQTEVGEKMKKLLGWE